MAFCRDCGTEIRGDALYCPKCGSRQDGVYQTYRQPDADDSGSVGWAILGFLIPVVGLILWLVWMDNKPKCSKMAGLGALASVIVGILFWVFLFAWAYAA